MSDIHGNSWALEAVLDDARARGLDGIVNLGDCFYGPLDPAGTAELLAGLDAPTALGNEDAILLEHPSAHPGSPSVDFTRSRLAAEVLDWIRGLPVTIVAFDSLFAFHGTPERTDEYLLHEVVERGVLLRGSGALTQRLAAYDQPVVLCGHGHKQMSVRLPDGRLVVNPGSVGCPAFSDDTPLPHSMETGSHHARYSIVSEDSGRWTVEEIAVDYDREVAARAAERNGRPEWAHWLRTGRAVITDG